MEKAQFKHFIQSDFSQKHTHTYGDGKWSRYMGGIPILF